MVSTRYVLCFFAFFALKVYGDDEAAVNQQEADDYLEKFGYLDGMKQRSGNPFQRQLARTRAIKSFQEFADLPVTGQLDEETQRKMLAPRCGMTDSRTRAGVSKWRKNQLTWAYVQPTTQIDSARVKSAIKESLAIWAQVVPLTFTEVSPQSRSDMVFGLQLRITEMEVLLMEKDEFWPTHFSQKMVACILTMMKYGRTRMPLRFNVVTLTFCL